MQFGGFPVNKLDLQIGQLRLSFFSSNWRPKSLIYMLIPLEWGKWLQNISMLTNDRIQPGCFFLYTGSRQGLLKAQHLGEFVKCFKKFAYNL